VQLAKKARDDFVGANEGIEIIPLIAASIGSYGAFIPGGEVIFFFFLHCFFVLIEKKEYKGTYADKMSKKELKSFHRERMILMAKQEE